MLSTPDPDVLQTQFAQFQHDKAFAELKAEYEKHVPQTGTGMPAALQESMESGTINIISDRDMLQRKIDSGEISKTISYQKQNKHIEGTPQFEQYRNSRMQKGDNPQSILTISQTEAQKLVDLYSGTGNVKIIRSRDGVVKIIEFVTADKAIGRYYTDNQFVDTKRFGIYYSKRGAHIVPVREDYDG